MSLGRRWVKRQLDRNHESQQDPHADEMSLRVMHALEQSIEAQSVAQAHAEEAQRLFGAIRREIAVTKIKDVKPK